MEHASPGKYHIIIIIFFVVIGLGRNLDCIDSFTSITPTQVLAGSFYLEYADLVLQVHGGVSSMDGHLANHHVSVFKGAWILMLQCPKSYRNLSQNDKRRADIHIVKE